MPDSVASRARKNERQGVSRSATRPRARARSGASDSPSTRPQRARTCRPSVARIARVAAARGQARTRTRGGPRATSLRASRVGFEAVLGQFRDRAERLPGPQREVRGRRVDDDRAPRVGVGRRLCNVVAGGLISGERRLTHGLRGRNPRACRALDTAGDLTSAARITRQRVCSYSYLLLRRAKKLLLWSKGMANNRYVETWSCPEGEQGRDHQGRREYQIPIRDSWRCCIGSFAVQRAGKAAPQRPRRLWRVGARDRWRKCGRLLVPRIHEFPALIGRPPDTDAAYFSRVNQPILLHLPEPPVDRLTTDVSPLCDIRGAQDRRVRKDQFPYNLFRSDLRIRPWFRWHCAMIQLQQLVKIYGLPSYAPRQQLSDHNQILAGRPTRRCSAFGSSQNGVPAPVVAHERRVGRNGDRMRVNDPRPKKDSDCRSVKVLLRDGLADCQDAEIVAFLACGHRPETTMTDETQHHNRRIDSRARASEPPTRIRGWCV